MVVHRLPWHDIRLYNDIGSNSIPSLMETTPESVSSKLLATADTSATENRVVSELENDRHNMVHILRFTICREFNITLL